MLLFVWWSREREREREREEEEQREKKKESCIISSSSIIIHLVYDCGFYNYNHILL